MMDQTDGSGDPSRRRDGCKPRIGRAVAVQPPSRDDTVSGTVRSVAQTPKLNAMGGPGGSLGQSGRARHRL